jgi:cytochrome b involved in lipid metabolism
MKKITTVSLFIFGVIVTAILVAGLVFYQDTKSSQTSSSQTSSNVQNTINKIKASGKSVVLNMSEISNHSSQSDCWLLISGKVYDITSYFGSHPGGNGTMAATCGSDATYAYMTKDPNATNSSGGRGGHSSNAKSLLDDYYLGNLNQMIN